jgi:hypothetical protein
LLNFEVIAVVEKGFNTDIVVEGSKYHIQTEDWGHANPFLVTQIFRNGAVVKSIKTSYREVFVQSDYQGQQALRLAMREQHQKILDRLLSGQLEFSSVK